MRRGSLSPTDDGSDELRLIEELDGYTDFGAHKEALRCADALLSRHRLSAEALTAVVRAIGMFGRLRDWSERVEAAYARQSARRKRQLDGPMLLLYGGFDDWQNAYRFASARRDWMPDEAVFAMEAMLFFGRFKEAKRLHVICNREIETLVRRIRRMSDEVDGALHALGFYAHTCAMYLARTGQYVAAAKSWTLVPSNHAFAWHAIRGRIDCGLSTAVVHLTEGEKAVNEMAKGDPTMLSLRGNHDKVIADYWRDLTRYGRHLQAVLPLERRKEFGLPFWEEEE